MKELLSIVFENDQFLVVNKPADLVCHPTKGDAYSSLISRARLHLGPQSHPQLINRLDRETSGLVVIARNPVAARNLRRIWELGNVRKTYLSIVRGAVGPDAQVIDAPIGPDRSSTVAIKDCVQPDGVPALTRFRTLHRFTQNPGLFFGEIANPESFSLLQVQPDTGRKHQIRIHLAHIGHPILGDKLYGGNPDAYLALVERRLTPALRRFLVLPHHALCAVGLSIPWENRELHFEAQPEDWFTTFCRRPLSQAAAAPIAP